jgi:biopolymer transport protein ExbB
MLREITETGRVVSFNTEVATPSGERAMRDVVRIGAFNVIDTQGNYLAYANDSLSVAAPPARRWLHGLGQ